MGLVCRAKQGLQAASCPPLSQIGFRGMFKCNRLGGREGYGGTNPAQRQPQNKPKRERWTRKMGVALEDGHKRHLSRARLYRGTQKKHGRPETARAPRGGDSPAQRNRTSQRRCCRRHLRSHGTVGYSGKRNATKARMRMHVSL